MFQNKKLWPFKFVYAFIEYYVLIIKVRCAATSGLSGIYADSCTAAKKKFICKGAPIGKGRMNRTYTKIILFYDHIMG